MFKKLDLQFFADDAGEDNNNENVNDEEDKDQASDETKNTENMIPYSRFKEVNDNYKALKAQLDEIKSQQEQEELEAKKKAGQFEELYTSLQSEHEPLKQQVAKYQEVFQSLLESKLQQVPENMKDLIPDGLDDLLKLQWIENALTKGLFGGNEVKSFGNRGNNPSNQKTTSSNTEFIKSLGRKF